MRFGRLARRGLVLVAATALVLSTACGDDSNPAQTTTTIVAGAPMRLPDDAALRSAYGPDAEIGRSSKPERGGTIDRACGQGNVALRSKTALGVKAPTPEGTPLEINVVLLEFPSAGVAAGYFTSFALGTLDCEWTDSSGGKRRLDDVAPLEDVNGARQLQVTVLHDTATGASATNTVLLRGPTVVDLGGAPRSAAAAAVARMATLLTG